LSTVSADQYGRAHWRPESDSAHPWSSRRAHRGAHAPFRAAAAILIRAIGSVVRRGRVGAL